ncbi:helix-turn-helix domain-containing protein (plasmid) [Haladaptatus sp. SPP-AMP-3]|uniref:helix-turn-helix domain-containing protein n=1 Tax=Haladaptatus sp. SPP-AMP-3 TaxID=3121295 RepID=UPI003C2AD421
MKSITVEIRVEDGFHAANRFLAEEPSITREGLHYVDILEDETIVLLYHLRGNLASVKTHLETHTDIIACDVPDGEDGLVYIHGRPREPVREFFSLARRHAVVFETPFKHVANGVRLTISGEESHLHRVVDDVPRGIELELVRKGEHRPESGEVESMLTDRQREILTVAVENGYYETPRKTTHEGIASVVGISTATVSEHLRKIESRVFSELVRR